MIAAGIVGSILNISSDTGILLGIWRGQDPNN